MRLSSLLQVFRLSLADFFHERTLTLCLVCSLAAVLAPLLILLGLKGGIIHAMMEELSGDPIHREIVPEGLLPFKADKNWIASIRARPDVKFILPNLRGLGMTIDVRSVGSKKSLKATARPSAPGDPLLVENHVMPPADGEAVVSHNMAEALGVAAGEEIEVTILRQAGGQFEKGTANFRVNGVAPVRATDQQVIWLSLEYLLDVETYIAGGAVPRLGWKGHRPSLPARFDGVIVATARELNSNELPRLMHLSGFGLCEKLTGKELRAQLGLAMPERWHLTLWRAVGNTVAQDNIAFLRTRLDEMGIESAVLPWLDQFVVEASAMLPGPLQGEKLCVSILDSGGAEFGISYSKSATFPFYRGFFQLSGAFKNRLSAPWLLSPLHIPPDSRQRVAFVSTENKLSSQREVLLHVKSAEGTETFTVRVPLHAVDWLPKKILCLPRLFAGQLRNAVAEGMPFDAATADFVPAAGGYRDFRLYARDVDAIGPLVAFFSAQGIPVRSNLMAVTHIKTMESFLDRLYYLIAGISAVAAFLAMMASLYANVERKRTVIAYLELVGIEQHVLFFFSIFQAVFLSFFAALLAAGIYLAFDGVVDRFVADLVKTSSVCRLTPQQAMVSFGCLFIGAILSSFVSAIQMLRLDPSEYLRQE